MHKFTAILSDFGQISPGSSYRAKTWIFDFNGSMKNPDSAPTITLYDPSRNLIVENVDMNFLEIGIYEYSFSSTSGQTAGQWEAIAAVTVNGSTVKPSDYWELTGNPPEVKINSIVDNTVPSITASVTITNEGTTTQEYQYEYCIVSQQTNQCGGSDDEDYAGGAKLIQPGQSWNPNLSLNVDVPSVYWFKVKVYYGTETSAASKQFEAVSPSGEPPASGGNNGGTGGRGWSGGTGFATIPFDKGTILITEYPSEMTVRQGDFEFFMLKVKNGGEGNLSELALSVENISPDWLSVEQDKKSLAPNEEASFVVKIIVPLNAEPKDYLGQFVFSAKEDRKEVSSVLSVLEKGLAEVRFLDVRISKMETNGYGEIETTLQNVGSEDLNLSVLLLSPRDWQVERNEFDLILKSGQQKKILFIVNASYRSGVRELVLLVKSRDGIVFSGTGEDKLSKQLLVVVYAPESPLVEAALSVNSVYQLGVLVLLAMAVIFFGYVAFTRTRPRRPPKLHYHNSAIFDKLLGLR
jgi:hypothetical protein